MKKTDSLWKQSDILFTNSQWHVCLFTSVDYINAIEALVWLVVFPLLHQQRLKHGLINCSV